MSAAPVLRPFKKLDQVTLAHHVPGCPYVIGEKMTVLSVVNTGTKRNPNWRYYVRGAWLDHDALEGQQQVVQ